MTMRSAGFASAARMISRWADRVVNHLDEVAGSVRSHMRVGSGRHAAPSPTRRAVAPAGGRGPGATARPPRRAPRRAPRAQATCRSRRRRDSPGAAARDAGAHPPEANQSKLHGPSLISRRPVAAHVCRRSGRPPHMRTDTGSARATSTPARRSCAARLWRSVTWIVRMPMARAPSTFSSRSSTNRLVDGFACMTSRAIS